MNRIYAYILLFIFSATLPSYSIELHYCKGNVTDVALFGTASCVCQDSQPEEKSDAPGCKFHCHSKQLDDVNVEKFAHKPCCKTEKITLSSAKLKAASSSKVELLAISPVQSIGDYLFASSSELRPEVFRYIPPDLHKDITIFFGTLLI